MHCNWHILNLVIARSCALPDVRNMFDKMKSTIIFFTYSPKRENLLVEFVNKDAHSTGQRKPLIDICCTRLAERHDAYNHFCTAFIFIVKALEVISIKKITAKMSPLDGRARRLQRAIVSCLCSKSLVSS